MELLVFLVALLVLIGTWWALSKAMHRTHWLFRHLAAGAAGCCAGFMAVVLAVPIGLLGPSTPSAAPSVPEPVALAVSAPPLPLGYTITQDDHRPGRPRKVDATVPRYLKDAELQDVATLIRDDTDSKAEKTFIGLRVEGQSDKSYWASVRFDPEYSANLIGLSFEDHEKLMALDISTYNTRLGHWLRDGALGHVMVLYTRGDRYFIDSIFPNGGKNTEEFKGSETAEGLRLVALESDLSEHYIVDDDNNLQGWGAGGMYLRLPPERI